MSALIVQFPRRHNVMSVQPCKSGFEVVLITPDGRHHHRGTRELLREARMLAGDEAFRVGRCKVQLFGTEDRV